MAETSKLHIDLEKRMLIAEGSEEFLKEMYAEFGKRIEALAVAKPTPKVQAILDDIDRDAETSGSVEETLRKTRARRSRTKSAPASSPAERVSNYSPEMEKDLDLSGLAEFCQPFAPKNHPERILLYALFLDDKHGIKPCTANQIYTCYRLLREKIPEAFIQALRDASGNRYGFIDYKSPTEVSVTTIGLNHFQHDGLKRKAVNER